MFPLQDYLKTKSINIRNRHKNIIMRECEVESIDGADKAEFYYIPEQANRLLSILQYSDCGVLILNSFN